MGELFDHHDAYEAYLAGSPLNRRDYKTKSFKRAELTDENDYRGTLEDLRRSNDAPADRARAMEEEIRALKIELNKVRSERNTMRKSMHDHARNAADHAAKKAERETRSTLDRAYGAKLRAKDERITGLEMVIGDLEEDIALLRPKIFETVEGRSVEEPDTSAS